MNEPQKARWLAPLFVFLLLILVPAWSVPADAQGEPKARIVDTVDESQLIELKGHVHPRVRTLRPAGMASGDLPMERMMLLLGSSPAQQESLEQLLAGQQDPSSSSYHRWLTPREFGEQFGPARQDIETITTWLRGHGFQVNAVAEGRRFVEFSGTAAQVAEAFHTQISSYVVEGKQYWANAANPYIPAALAPAVKGIVSLHNFPRRAMHRAASQTALPIINATITGQLTSSSGTHLLGPYDFATIYNLLPLWNAGTDGTAQSIAVIAQSNIDTGNVSDFQNLFGLPVKLPQIILNGPDPGLVSITGDETESELDVQWSGAVAKGATILLVVSEGTNTAEGVDLSAEYAVDNNLAPIVSMSYGDCEQDLSGQTVQGTPDNQFYGLLWQQAAVQGISVFVSAGDQGSGSAGCDDSSSTQATLGFAVNGLASTPYNVAVGGTEFNEGGDSTYWNSVSGAHLASANRYIPEVVWNDSATSAGSGGVSTIYSRPLWQTGTGVPAQDPGSSGQPHRLLPDVSLTASPSHDGYAVCLNRVCPGSVYIYGGTSVSAQAFAGLMAMVNQSTGSIQGNPNFHFYPLANISGVYHDITSGTNAVPCAGASPNCSSTTAGVSGVMNGYSAGTGYDLATGWGSVDANAMVTNWPTVTLGKSTATLAVTAGYGKAIFGSTVAVKAMLGSPSATGEVQFYDNGALIGGFVNVSGGTAPLATSSLALGTHSITASYSGDAAFNFLAAGSSVPFTLQVVQQAAPAASLTPQFDPVNFAYAPGSALSFTVQFSSTAFGPAPTGTLSVLDGTTLLWTASASGGAGSVLTFNTAAKPFSLGTHSLQLTYSGDTNWASVASSSVAVTIANPDFTLTAQPSLSVVPGGFASVSISSSSIAGYSGSLSFSCSGLPAESSCSFSPASLTAGSATDLTIATTAPGTASLTAGSATDLTIATTAPGTASLHQDHRLHPGSWRASAVLVLGVLLAGAQSKRRYRLGAFWLVLAGALIAGTACSSGGSSDPGTPAGTYTVTVTATSGALTHSATFTLTVN